MDVNKLIPGTLMGQEGADRFVALKEAGDELAAVATEWGRKSGVAYDAEMHARLASALAVWEEAKAEAADSQPMTEEK